MYGHRESDYLWIGFSPVLVSRVDKAERGRGNMLHNSSYTNGVGTRSRSSSSPLKSLPDTRLSKFSTLDEDSGIGNTVNGMGRYKGTAASLTSHSPLKAHTNFNSSLSDSFNASHDLGRSHDFSRSHDFNRSFDPGLTTTNTFDDTGRKHDIFDHSSRLHDSSLSARSSPSRSFMSRDSGVYNDSRLNTSVSLPMKYGALDRSKSRSLNLLEAQLDDSEQRRTLLVEKLADAKFTIKQQADKLEVTEHGYRDTNYTLDDYKYREREHRKQVEALEKEKQDYQGRRLSSLKQREELQERVSGLENEIELLKTSTTLLEAESKRKDEVLQQTTQATSMVQDEHFKLLKAKENATKELSAVKESLDIARNRNEWLENQTQDTKTDAERLRRENHSLTVDNRSMSSQLHDLRTTSSAEREEQSTNKGHIRNLREEKTKLQRQLETFQENVADLKATLASTSSDKERFFQEKLDLHQKLQNLTLEKETAVKEKLAFEDQVSEMNAQVAQVRLRTDKEKEDTRRTYEELAAVKKVGEVLSLELASTKANLEKVMEQNHSLEQTKKIAFQQHALYEQEIRSLETQTENLKRSMESMRGAHSREREGLDDGTIKLKDELRQTRSERNQLELTKHELEAKLKQAELNLKENNSLLQREMETWKNSCEKMTASLSRKEMEVQQLHKKLEDYENHSGIMQVNQHTFQSQYEELTEAREEVLRVQADNRRLLQERAENQQVIQLLEMQKNILSKTSEESQSRVHDIAKLQCQVEQLQKDKGNLEEKMQAMDKIKEKLMQEKEDRLEENLLRSAQTATSEATRVRFKDLEKQNQQLRDVNNMVTEQLTRTEKENKQLQDRDVVPKQELRRVEIERTSAVESLTHIREQHKKLEEMYHKVLADRETTLHRRGSDAELVSVRHQSEAFEQKVTSLEKQLVLCENSKQRTVDHSEKLSAQLDELSQKLISSSQDQTVHMTSLQKQNNQLQSELEDAKNVQRKQDMLIQSFKEELDEEKTRKPNKIRQSLDDVGNELNVMRRELQKLMGVINMKDHEISTLNTQLKNSKHEMSHSLVKEKDDLEERNKELEDETQELNNEVDRLQEALGTAKSEMRNLQTDLQAIEGNHENASSKVLENLRRELAGKNRQIESLEEQLRRNTSAEIRRLKREAGKVQLLKAENRRLANEIQTHKGKPVLECNAVTSESQNDSWDSDSNSPLVSYGRHLKTQSMEDTEREALEDLQDDDDVKNVVAMLDNVEFTDTLGMSASRDYEHDDVTPEEYSDEQRMSDGDSTPRARPEVNNTDISGVYSTRKSTRFSSYPNPIVALDGPNRSHTSSRYTSDIPPRPRSRSSSRSPPRSTDRARSYDRTGTPYQARSMSYDRALSSRSYDISLGYGSLGSSGDINARSIPDSAQRYRSNLADLGPAPGETKEERRRRMRELLRTLDKPSPRLPNH